MDQIYKIREVILLVFTAVYLFSFRDAIKVAASLGAFELKKRSLILKKFTYSILLIVFAPLAMYYFFSRSIADLINQGSNGPNMTSIFLPIGLTILYGLFPIATKHVWNLVARKKLAKGRGEGEPGEGWINSSIERLDDYLPHIYYSWQASLVIGLVPVLIIAFQVFHKQFPLSLEKNDLRNLFVAIYAGQLVVLHHMAKLRGYFYPRHPKFLIYPRTVISFFGCIVIPIVFGIFLFLWLLRLQLETSRIYLILGIAGLVIAFPFPLYCTNSILLIARKFEWVSRTERPEIYDQETWPWKVFFVVAILCAIALGYIVWHQKDFFFAVLTQF